MHTAVYTIKNAVRKGTAQLYNALLQRRLREPGHHISAFHMTHHSQDEKNHPFKNHTQRASRHCQYAAKYENKPRLVKLNVK